MDTMALKTLHDIMQNNGMQQQENCQYSVEFKSHTHKLFILLLVLSYHLKDRDTLQPNNTL